jgi:hypothetical protein
MNLTNEQLQYPGLKADPELLRKFSKDLREGKNLYLSIPPQPTDYDMQLDAAAAELLANRERIKENDETFALMDAQNIRLTADNATLTAWKERAGEAMRLMRQSLYMSKGYLDAMTAMRDLIGGRDGD